MCRVSSSFVSAYAPGRVEFLGNHTDYNEGVVLAAAIDRGLTVRGTRRDDGAITLRSATLGRSMQSCVTNLRPLQGDDAWANYALGVARELLAAGVTVTGFDAELYGDLPLGNGLSSSPRLRWRPLFSG